MPTLSASDYTNFLKFKAASISTIQPSIQTRVNVSPLRSVINANLLASQAAFVTTPYSTQTYTNAATVSAASSQTVSTARVDIISAVTGGSNLLTYTTSQPHGLTTGDTITVAGLTQNTLNTTPNVSNASVTVTGASSFTVASTGASGASSGTGRITGRAYYTTTVAHGLTAGTAVTITGTTNFNLSGASVIVVPSATTFATTTAIVTAIAAETSATGTINGYVYYTTSAAHGLLSGTQNITVSGLSTSAFNLSLATVGLVPSATVFALVSSATGTNVTSASGVLTITYFTNTNTTIRNNARVVGIPEVQTRSTNKAKSTLSWTSGTSGSVGSTTSSKFQQGGGLPAKGRVGVYTRLPQNAGWGGNNL